ncbi:hypothetical protein ACHAWO_008807 [Cyclotella atomus]|uniref:Uncharacterized protein n=1 Tax=Cyclotella atomus TaxID=382360 RepID=A0ABD3NEL5_9STRA
MDKAEDRRMRHVKVVERNAEHKLKQAVDAKDKVIKTMSKVLDGNRSSAASAHVALANLRKEHDEEMKLMESKHKKSMAAARKQYNTVINQKNTRIHRLEAQVLEMQQLCDGIAEE